jgi:hypothetical protein
MGTQNLQEYRLAVAGNGDKGNEGQRQETNIQDEPRSPLSHAIAGKIWIQQHYHMPGTVCNGEEETITHMLQCQILTNPEWKGTSKLHSKMRGLKEE